MGNRAVITNRDKRVGVYLHWGGDPHSVRALLRFCELKRYRPPDEDHYGWARLCQVAGNYFGGALSVGIDALDHLDCDNRDNGMYVIEDWRVEEREHKPEDADDDEEEPGEETVRLGILLAINDAQPERERLPRRNIIDLEPVKNPEEPRKG